MVGYNGQQSTQHMHITKRLPGRIRNFCFKKISSDKVNNNNQRGKKYGKKIKTDEKQKRNVNCVYKCCT